jgi:hypothetical protein
MISAHRRHQRKEGDRVAPRNARRFALLTIALGALLSGSGVVQAQDPGSSAPPGRPGWLGAVDEVYRDPFDVAGEWLDLGEDESGRTSLEDGRLFMSVNGPNGNYWDAWVAPEPSAVMRVEATVDLDDASGTGAGVACGSASGLPRWFVAGVNNADEWWFGRLIDGRLQVVERGLLMLPTSASQSPVSVAIECATVPAEGGDRVLISVDGRPVTTVSRLDIPVGPFDKAGVLIGSDEGTGSATFDDLVVHVGDAYALRDFERVPGRPSE